MVMLSRSLVLPRPPFRTCVITSQGPWVTVWLPWPGPHTQNPGQKKVMPPRPVFLLGMSPRSQRAQKIPTHLSLAILGFHASSCTSRWKVG